MVVGAGETPRPNEIPGGIGWVRHNKGVTRRPPARRPTVGSSRHRSKPSSKPGGAKPGVRNKGEAHEVEHTDTNPPRQITVRTLILGVVLLMAFVLITPTLRAYVRQQEDMRELNAELSQAQQESEELQAQMRRWDDDEFIKAQARERFGFVMPGEKPYRVIDPDAVVEEELELESDLVTSIPVGSGPWYVDVWESVNIAGELEP